eukprot:TRINITY_DN358_c0_g2_i1.p1 TRINITY_DN358_c0_g2~~TRINITY_DN358_c0_g2_i1.p1  ORF type:complete len:320 (+),score=72.77 TRINITY_DN358_c0_g2_i1:235-1194(+)
MIRILVVIFSLIVIAYCEKALIIGVDGMGGLYFEQALKWGIVPNMQEIVTLGAGTTKCRNFHPQISAPNWAAILTGMSPVESGVVDNQWNLNQTAPSTLHEKGLPPISGIGKIPETVFDVAKTSPLTKMTAASTSWDWFEKILKIDPSVDKFFCSKEDDFRAATWLTELILTSSPDLMFIHFDQVDTAGHHHQWGSEEYYKAIARVDKLVGMLLHAIKSQGIIDETMVVLTADHGGYKTEHGKHFSQLESYVPLFFSGTMIKCGMQLGNNISLANIAPTVLHSMGIKKGKFMHDEALDEIFTFPYFEPHCRDEQEFHSS